MQMGADTLAWRSGAWGKSVWAAGFDRQGFCCVWILIPPPEHCQALWAKVLFQHSLPLFWRTAAAQDCFIYPVPPPSHSQRHIWTSKRSRMRCLLCLWWSVACVHVLQCWQNPLYCLLCSRWSICRVDMVWVCWTGQWKRWRRSGSFPWARLAWLWCRGASGETKRRYTKWPHSLAVVIWVALCICQLTQGLAHLVTFITSCHYLSQVSQRLSGSRLAWSTTACSTHIISRYVLNEAGKLLNKGFKDQIYDVYCYLEKRRKKLDKKAEMRGRRRWPYTLIIVLIRCIDIFHTMYKYYYCR